MKHLVVALTLLGSQCCFMLGCGERVSNECSGRLYPIETDGHVELIDGFGRTVRVFEDIVGAELREFPNREIIGYRRGAEFVLSADGAVRLPDGSNWLVSRVGEDGLLTCTMDGLVWRMEDEKWTRIDGLDVVVYSEDQDLHPARASGTQLWGYVDDRLEFVLPPEWDLAEQFSEGRAIVKEGEHYGVIDSGGEWIVAPQYVLAFAYSEGLAVVCKASESAERDDVWGFIDRSGRPAFGGATYAWAGSFSDGLAAVQAESHSGERGYINRDGTVAIPATFDEAGPFSMGYAIVVEGGSPFVIARDGEVQLSINNAMSLSQFDGCLFRVFMQVGDDVYMRPDGEIVGLP